MHSVLSMLWMVTELANVSVFDESGELFVITHWRMFVSFVGRDSPKSVTLSIVDTLF